MAADDNTNSTKKIEELDQVLQYVMFSVLLRMVKLGYGGVLEMSAKEATACYLLQRQRRKADRPIILYIALSIRV